jgi:hypothetical protein
MSAAFILAVSSLTAGAPFILSERAGAVSGYGYSGVSMDASNWIVDRQVPSGGWSVDAANGRVLLFVDQTKSSSVAHQKTEGVSTQVEAGSTSISGSVYINADWNTKPELRVGLWGVTNAPASWPIIEYANVTGYNGWRVWDTVLGGWVNLPGVSKGAGNYKLEILINTLTNSFQFYINDVQVATLGAGGKTSFEKVILNSYNVGTGDKAGNYVVDWRNVKGGRTEAPVINTAPVYVNNSEANDYATWTHSGDAVAGFEYREYMTLEAANADTTGTTGAYWTVQHLATDRSQVVGQSWTGEQVLYYRVVTIDIYGNRSLPSAVGTIIIDKVAPTVELPAYSGEVRNSLTVNGTVTDTYGIDNYRYQILDENKNNLSGDLAGYGNSRAGGTGAVDGGELFTVDTTPLPTGNYTIRVWAFDKAGNRTGDKNAPYVTSFSVDKDAPEVTITNPESNITVGNNAKVAIEATIGDAVGYKISINSNTVLDAAAPFTTYEWDTNDLPSGTYTIDVEGRDAVGNTSTDTVVITVDNNGPTINFDLLEDEILSGLVEIPGTVTDGDAATYQFVIYNQNDVPVLIVAQGNVSPQFNTRSFANGQYYAVATARDSFGNPSQKGPVNFSIFNAVILNPTTPGDEEGDDQAQDDEEGEIVTAPVFTVPAAINPAAYQQVLGDATGDSATNADDTQNEGVEGTSTENILAQAVDSDSNQGIFMGIAWYWWLLILAGVSGLGWWVASLLRKNA